MIDLHCHILPGMDDGPAELDGSLRMLERLAKAGYRYIFATPHIPWGTAKVDMEDFRKRGGGLVDEIRKISQSAQLDLAAEHYSDIVPELIHGQGPLSYPRDDTFLMEFPLSGFPSRLEDLLFLLEVKGKKAVIAHVERYPEVQKNPSVVEKLRDKGCFLLANLSSLAGTWSREAQKTAKVLFEEGLVDAATTDLHEADQMDAVTLGLRMLEDLVGSEEVDRLVRTMPAHIAGIDPDRRPGSK
jgi:protein-tyrosine phosphatase